MVKQITKSHFEIIKQWENCGYIGEDFLLVDRINVDLLPFEARRLDYIVIALCTGGEARYRIDGEEQTLKQGDVFIISENHVIDSFTASSDLLGICFFMSVDFFHEIIQSVSNVSALFLFARTHPVISLSAREQQVFQQYFNSIRDSLKETDNPFLRHLVRTLMLAMFYSLSNVIYHFQQQPVAKQKRANAIFNQFIKMVEKNCHHERRVSWYAQQLNITPKYLSEAVKSISKRTPNDWIDSCVIIEARVLLKNSSKSIKEIAEELNFANQSFLGKYFKERVGMSPKAYRQS